MTRMPHPRVTPPTSNSTNIFTVQSRQTGAWLHAQGRHGNRCGLLHNRSRRHVVVGEDLALTRWPWRLRAGHALDCCYQRHRRLLDCLQQEPVYVIPTARDLSTRHRTEADPYHRPVLRCHGEQARS
jgi:hypothetical protein